MGWSVAKALAPIMKKHNMYWGSFQINVNSHSVRHADKNNIGKSVMFTLGSFTSGGGSGIAVLAGSDDNSGKDSNEHK